MTEARKLTLDEAAERAGMARSTFATYVSKAKKKPGLAPQPDGHFGRTPYWFGKTIDAWLRERPGQGAGGGRPPKDKPAEVAP